jgi:poly-gamma-glutamate capsule biosynthesis protein CapA/YwtB (metallophosphatase superfamily)
MVRLMSGLLGLLVLAGCASAVDRDEETGPSPTPSVTSAPTTSSPAGGESPPLQPQSSEPLVLAVHPRRPPANLSQAQAGLLLDGGVTRWQQLGLPGGRLKVTHDRQVLPTLPRDTVAVVPASAVGPGVQVLSVEGIDPLRRPDDYPLRAAGPAPGRVTTLTVVGDMMLGRRVGARAAAVGDPSYPLRPMAHRLASADITVGNLESTLSTEGRPRQGDDSFAADPGVRTGLRAAGFDAIGLANNHTGDYGDRALVRTVALLRQGGLRPFGAGADLREARQASVVRRHGTSFGFVGFNAIGETPEAGPTTPGANAVSMPPRTGPLDRDELARVLGDVRRLARRVDVVVVMPHWGTQYTARPEPVQQRVARDLVDAGADLVVGGHPHWVQGASLVGDALVVQSLGNLVFDMDFMPETQEGLVLQATFWDDELKGVRFVPYRIGPDFAPRVVAASAAGRLFANFWRFSRLGATPR